MDEIYLDNAATTRPLSEVINRVTEVMENDFGNPSSLHHRGAAAERHIQQTRKFLATLLEVKPGEIYFTSGGTESNNLALKGTALNYKNRGQHLITTQIEHPSVYNAFKSLEETGFKVTYLQPDSRGIISPQQLQKALKPETILVSIMYVNNELGSLEPVSKLAQTIKNYSRDIFFHVDAVQALGKIPLHPQQDNIDLLTVSAHKINGPQGVGALYMKNGMMIKPLLEGGGQERDLRSGTENTPGIAGFLPALKNIPRQVNGGSTDEQLASLKQFTIRQIQNTISRVQINTPQQSAPHIINISLPDIKGEVLVHALEEDDIYVSTGSACHSRQKINNRILKAINLSEKYLEGTIRISLSALNTKQEMEHTVHKIKEKIDYLNI